MQLNTSSASYRRWLFAAITGMLMVLPAVGAAAQAAPVRVTQTGDGRLLIVQGTIAWPLVPSSIEDTDFDSLTQAGEIDADLPLNGLSAGGVPTMVQRGDGTLYLVQGESAWLIVPAAIDNADLANLRPGGEIDGTLPVDLLSSPPAATPAATAPPAPAPAAAAAPAVVLAPTAQASAPVTPTGSPSPGTASSGNPAPLRPTGCPVARVLPEPLITPSSKVITGTADLSGQLDSTKTQAAPVPIAVGATITSMLHQRLPYDMEEDFAIYLTCDTTYTFVFSSSNAYGDGPINVIIDAPNEMGYSTYSMGTIQVHAQEDTKNQFFGDCWVLHYHDNYYGPPQIQNKYDCTFKPPATGAYVLRVLGTSARSLGKPQDSDQY